VVPSTEDANGDQTRPGQNGTWDGAPDARPGRHANPRRFDSPTDGRGGYPQDRGEPNGQPGWQRAQRDLGRPEPGRIRWQPEGQPRPYDTGGHPQPYSNGGGHPQPYSNGGGQPRPYNTGGQPRPYNAGSQPRPYNTGSQLRPFDTGGQLRPYDTDQLWRPAPGPAANGLQPAVVNSPPAAQVTNPPAGQASKALVPQGGSNPKKPLRGMAAAMTEGQAGVGEFKPVRSPLRPRQFIIAVIAVAVGVALSVVSYRLLTGQPGSFSGQVTPAHAYYLNFPNNGAIDTVTVRPGQSVKAGQVLATQNGSVAKARLGADEATVKADQAEVSQDQTLLQEGSPTATPATVATAQANLASAQAQLVSDQSSVSQSEIIAPASGIVADVTGAPGDFAGPSGVRGFSGPAAQSGTSQNNGFHLFVGGSSGTGSTGSSSASGFQPFITLYTEPLTVTAQIPQQNITGVHVGQRATLTFATLSKPVSGTVELIIGTPVRTSSGTFYDVVISISADQAQMTPGMTVNVTLS
jgi:multidrug efflux pump subunit AcrA (membrane-fusion protein)